MGQLELIALILFACDVRRGEWVSLDYIAGRVSVPGDEVRKNCEQLVADGLLQHATRDGMPLYGVGAEGVRP